MAILWMVNHAEVPLLMKRLKEQSDPYQHELKRDWCEFKPENTMWKKAHGVDWGDLIKAVAFVASWWILAIWLSCK